MTCTILGLSHGSQYVDGRPPSGAVGRRRLCHPAHGDGRLLTHGWIRIANPRTQRLQGRSVGIDADGTRRTLRSLTAAASAIWLVTPNVNLMLESAWDRTEALDDANVRAAGNHFVLLPGMRAAVNLPSGMQIVPGFGVPIGVGPSRGQRDLFLYLSIEHPFRRAANP